MIIDSLTYNRIKTLEKCSDFEKDIIQTVCCEIADFQFENKEELQSVINQYSINGVSITFGQTNNNIKNINGFTILNSSYEKLCNTRFTQQNIGVCY